MNTLQEYAEVFERLGLTELHAEDGELRLTLRKETAGNAAGTTAPVIMQQAAPSSENAATAPSVAEAPEQPRRGEAVKAPLLGIYHARSGADPVAVGVTVHKGEALCTIEAMKMMNEVTSPKDGVITEVLVSEGSLVEYHQELFVIE